jgi:hypothetical protein
MDLGTATGTAVGTAAVSQTLAAASNPSRACSDLRRAIIRGSLRSNGSNANAPPA